MIRVDLHLEDSSEWVKVFDPRDCTLSVAHEQPPEVGTAVRIDLVVGEGGPRVLLRGTVMQRNEVPEAGSPAGFLVALGAREREKINYLNGFVRGGLLDLRERRRLPLRLAVTYGGVDGAHDSYTRDINEEGVFIVTETPLPEESRIHMLVKVPGRDEPLSLHGTVSHTVLTEDEDVPGMGILFDKGDRSEDLTKAIDNLEAAFVTGKLDDEFLL